MDDNLRNKRFHGGEDAVWKYDFFHVRPTDGHAFQCQSTIESEFQTVQQHGPNVRLILGADWNDTRGRKIQGSKPWRYAGWRQ